MKNIAITWDDFKGPCYDPQEKYGDCPQTLLDVLNDSRIPTDDRIWAFCKCKKVNDREKRLFAVKAVRETPLQRGGTTLDLIADPRSLNALDVAEKHANGEATDEDLASARDAARDATKDMTMDAEWAVACAAAIDAASYAACAAARAAAGDAAWAAASAAVWDAARAAAGDAAREAQLQMIISLIES